MTIQLAGAKAGGAGPGGGPPRVGPHTAKPPQRRRRRPVGRPRLLAARQSNAPARPVREWIGGSGAPTYQKRLEGCSGVMLRPGVSIGPHDPHHSGQQGGHSHDLIQHDNSTPFLFCYDFTPVLTVLSMDAPLILPPALPASIVHFSVFSSIQKELLFRSLSC